MSTSDGIPDKEWDIVKSISADIANAVEVNADERYLRARLDSCLATLEKQYGRCPSILATKADYCYDVQKKLSLFKEAYCSACELRDYKNISLINVSLVDMYMDDFINHQLALYWLCQLKINLNNFSDQDLEEEFLDLKCRLEQEGLRPDEH